MKDIGRNVDLLMLSDTKTDDSFPKSQRLLKRSGDPFSLDRNVNGGWNMKLGKIFRQSFCLLKFIKDCINTLNNHAPSKQNCTRDNHLPFINKGLPKAIMN